MTWLLDMEIKLRSASLRESSGMGMKPSMAVQSLLAYELTKLVKVLGIITGAKIVVYGDRSRYSPYTICGGYITFS